MLLKVGYVASRKRSEKIPTKSNSQQDNWGVTWPATRPDTLTAGDITFFKMFGSTRLARKSWRNSKFAP